MPTIRIECSSQDLDLLNRDRNINIFYFDDPTDTDPASVAWSAVYELSEFYTGGVNPLLPFFSAVESGQLTMKAYLVGAPLHSPPVLVATVPFVPPAGHAGLPEEVACCLSYYIFDRNQPGFRGRIYLGPLNTAAMTDDVHPIPSPAFVTAMQSCATRLAQAAMPINTTTGAHPTLVSPSTPPPAGTFVPNWSLRSRQGVPGGPYTYVGMSGGWIDNEWDTQRRRRIRATARALWHV